MASEEPAAADDPSTQAAEEWPGPQLSPDKLSPAAVRTRRESALEFMPYSSESDGTVPMCHQCATTPPAAAAAAARSRRPYPCAAPPCACAAPSSALPSAVRRRQRGEIRSARRREGRSAVYGWRDRLPRARAIRTALSVSHGHARRRSRRLRDPVALELMQNMLAGDLMVIEAYENQRFRPFKGFSPDYLMFTDRGRFSHRDGLPSPVRPGAPSAASGRAGIPGGWLRSMPMRHAAVRRRTSRLRRTRTTTRCRTSRHPAATAGSRRSGRMSRTGARRQQPSAGLLRTSCLAAARVWGERTARESRAHPRNNKKTARARCSRSPWRP